MPRGSKRVVVSLSMTPDVMQQLDTLVAGSGSKSRSSYISKLIREKTRDDVFVDSRKNYTSGGVSGLNEIL